MSIRDSLHNVNSSNDRQNCIMSSSQPNINTTIPKNNKWYKPQNQPQQQQQPQPSRREPFPVKVKPEVIVKEYPGWASTGNYNLNQLVDSSGLENRQSMESVTSPQLLRPSKFWPQPQQSTNKSQPNMQQNDQMRRQVSQPCLSNDSKQSSYNSPYYNVIEPQMPKRRTYSVNTHQPYQKAIPEFATSDDMRIGQRVWSPSNQLQRQQKQPQSRDNLWLPVNQRTVSCGPNSPTDGQCSAYQRARQQISNYLQQPLEPSFGRQAITPPPFFTYEYQRISPSPSPPPSMMMESLYDNRSSSPLTGSCEQFHSARTSPYSSQPSLVVINRSPMGSNSHLNVCDGNRLDTKQNLPYFSRK